MHYVLRNSLLLTVILLIASIAKAFIVTKLSSDTKQYRKIQPLRSFAQLIDGPAVVGEADRAFRRGMQVRQFVFFLVFLDTSHKLTCCSSNT